MNDPTVVIYDVQDPFHPQALCTLPNAGQARFISSTEISYADLSANSPSIVRLSLGTSASPRSVITGPGLAGPFSPFAWAPDSTTLAYLVDTGSSFQLWLKRGEADAKPMDAPRPYYGHGIGPGDQVTLKVSSTGTYLALVDTISQGQSLQVWHLPDGVLSFGEVGANLAVWDRVADRLWYHDAQGIKQWTPGSTLLVAAGLNWFDPAASPDGQHVAYTLIDPTTGAPHVEIRDANGHVQPLSQPNRSWPLYVSTQTLWYYVEQPCTGPCPARLVPPSSTLFAYDIAAGRETALPFGTVFDVWPH
jgi:hypothetical protein